MIRDYPCMCKPTALCFKAPPAVIVFLRVMLLHSPPLFAPPCAVRSPLVPSPLPLAPRRNRHPRPTWFPRGDPGALPVIGGNTMVEVGGGGHVQM